MGEPALREAAPEDDRPAPSTFELERTGADSLRFKGRLVGSLSDEHLDHACWSELRLYERPRRGPVIEIVVRRGAIGLEDVRHAFAARSLDEAFGFLESIDPASPGPCGPAAEGSLSPTVKVLAHLSRRMRLQHLRHAHAALVDQAVRQWRPEPATLAAPTARAARRAIRAPKG